MPRPWPIIETSKLATTPIFQLTCRRSASPQTGQLHEFYVLEAPDWINVIPLTEDDQVLMIRQYRHGTSEVSLEIPGGMVEPTDGSPREAAVRELIEETGYRAGRIDPIGAIAPNPAIQNNICHSFLATDLDIAPGGMDRGHDGTEEIEVVRIPLIEVPDLIRQGAITHALVVVAFTFLMGEQDR